MTESKSHEAWLRFLTELESDIAEMDREAKVRYIPADVSTLSALLEDAKNAHTLYAPDDEDWPRWYAEWLLGLRDEKGELR